MVAWGPLLPPPLASQALKMPQKVCKLPPCICHTCIAFLHVLYAQLSSLCAYSVIMDPCCRWCWGLTVETSLAQERDANTGSSGLENVIEAVFACQCMHSIRQSGTIMLIARADVWSCLGPELALIRSLGCKMLSCQLCSHKGS